MGQDELGKIYGEGSWNALEQGNQQVGLANMYQNQRAQANALENEKNTLANLYASQNDPQRLENQRLTNEGLVNTNMLGGVTARRAAANEGMQLTQDQRDFALKATDSDLKQAEQHAQQQMYSGDPRQVEEARKILDFTVAARAAKAKADADMSLGQMNRASAEKIAAGHDAASRYGSDVRASTAKGRQTGAKTVEDALAGAKTFQAKSNVYDSAAQKARLAGDDEMARYYAQLSQQAAEQDIAARQAAAQVASGNQLDLQALQETGKLQRQNRLQGPGTTSPLAAARQPLPQQGPQPGQVYKGHVFLGGDPSNKANWKAQ